jgi:hypothetical protein
VGCEDSHRSSAYDEYLRMTAGSRSTYDPDAGYKGQTWGSRSQGDEYQEYEARNVAARGGR